MTITEFFADLISRTAPSYRDMVRGIAETYCSRGSLSDRQLNALRISASKAGLNLPTELRDGDSADQSDEWEPPELAGPDYDIDPFPAAFVITAGMDMMLHKGDRIVLRYGQVYPADRSAIRPTTPSGNGAKPIGEMPNLASIAAMIRSRMAGSQ